MYTCYPALWGLVELNTGWIDVLSDFKFYSYRDGWRSWDLVSLFLCNHFLPGFMVAPHTLPVSSFLPRAFPSQDRVLGCRIPVVNPADSMFSFAAGRCALFRNLDFKIQINRHLCNLISTIISTTCQVLGMKTDMSPLQEQSTIGDAFAASCFSSSFFSTWWSFMTFAASIRRQDNRPGVKPLWNQHGIYCFVHEKVRFAELTANLHDQRPLAQAALNVLVVVWGICVGSRSYWNKPPDSPKQNNTGTWKVSFWGRIHPRFRRDGEHTWSKSSWMSSTCDPKKLCFERVHRWETTWHLGITTVPWVSLWSSQRGLPWKPGIPAMPLLRRKPADGKVVFPSLCSCDFP